MFDIMSTGVKYLDKAIVKKESVCHIRSDNNTNTYAGKVEYEFYLSDFYEVYKNIIKIYDDVVFIPCSEKGVASYEIFTSYFDVNINEKSLSKARYNKNDMGVAIRNYGLRYVNESRVKKHSELSFWIENNPSEKGYVLKPVRSAASDKVYVCDGIDDVLMFFSHSIGEKNLFGETISEMLVQEYISGVLFFVNTVSLNGKHTITDVWKTNRTKLDVGAFIFEDMELVNFPCENLTSYALSCLDALHIDTGASHIEIIVDELGPVLIEVNCRLMGASIDDVAFNKAGVLLQHDLSYYAYTDHHKYEEILKNRKYDVFGSLHEISLYLNKSGVIIDLPFKEYVSKLKSFHSFSDIPKVGDIVEKDLSTLGTGGFIYLYSEIEDLVKSDLCMINNIKNDFFKIG
ncbi:TPA: ATP-grasp domain-containing protein [Vibrio vulnificus]